MKTITLIFHAMNLFLFSIENRIRKIIKSHKISYEVKCASKFIAILFLLVFSFSECNIVYANSLSNHHNETIGEIDKRIDSINKAQNVLNRMMINLHKYQKYDIESNDNLMIAISRIGNNSTPLAIKIVKNTNWYQYVIPFLTLLMIIGSTILSIRTVTIKSNESLASLERSILHQQKISSDTIIAERERSRRQSISSHRQKWINSLRDEMSSLLSVLSKSVLSSDAYEIMRDQLWIHFYKIQLLLNPNDEEHNRLVESIRNIIENITVEGETHEATKEAISISQNILKREWERVKKFEEIA